MPSSVGFDLADVAEPTGYLDHPTAPPTALDRPGRQQAIFLLAPLAEGFVVGAGTTGYPTDRTPTYAYYCGYFSLRYLARCQQASDLGE